MIQLTDDLIKDAFVKTGFDEKYFELYKDDVIRRYNKLQHDCPDDEETPDKVSNVIESIRQADIYITFYIKEAEKGHSESWASSYAENRISTEDETDLIKVAYNSVGDDEQKEKDLDIYVNSLSSDVIFRDRFKFLFLWSEEDVFEKAAAFTRAYHNCIQNGKSEFYAHGYGNAVNYIDGELYRGIYAVAFERARIQGMNEEEASLFGNDCYGIYANKSWWDFKEFLIKYHENWQKEFYLYLYGKDYLREHNRAVPESELDDLRHELYN